MSLYKSLSVAERANIHKLYKKVNPNMSYRDIISDFDREESLPQYPDGGNLPKKPNTTIEPYQAKDQADYKYRQQMYSDSLDLHKLSKIQYDITKGHKIQPLTPNRVPFNSTLAGREENERIRPGYNAFTAYLSGKSITEGEIDEYERKTGNTGYNSEFSKKGWDNPTPEDLRFREEFSKINNSNINLIKRGSPEFFHKTIKPIAQYQENYPSPDQQVGHSYNILYKKPVQQVLPPPGSNVQNTTQAQVNTTQPNPVSTQPQRPVYQPIDKMPVRGLETDYDKQSSMNKRSVPVMEDNTEARPFTASNYLKHTDQPIGEWVSTLKGGKVIKEPMFSREQLEKMNKSKLVSRAHGGYIDWTKRY
jgi:hypothetical protein